MKAFAARGMSMAWREAVGLSRKCADQYAGAARSAGHIIRVADNISTNNLLQVGRLLCTYS